MRHNRRQFLKLMSYATAAPLLARCGGLEPGPTGSPAADFVAPQTLTTAVTRAADGTWVRTFSGVAAPQNLDVEGKKLYDLFPRPHNPFSIGTDRQLGAGGMNLSVPDRTLAGVIPSATDLLPLSMVPFGVALDGVLMDPSGPWYDGGPGDPQNPMDRACSGWEYDPISAAGSDLVGVPLDVRGHVQPGPGGQQGSAGLFHYHGAPRVMLANLRASLGDEARRAPLVVGYSADGYWVLDAVVPAEATVRGKRLYLFSGYVLREARAGAPHTNPALVPAGAPDGTFAQDWLFDPERKRALIDAALRDSGEYNGLTAGELSSGAAELALLDERNGLVTDDLRLGGAPERSYVYAITPDWPEIPRRFAFQPSPSFCAVIPLTAPEMMMAPPGGGMPPPGRQQLYDACDGKVADVHPWSSQPVF